MKDFTDRELATVLSALRYWQHEMIRSDGSGESAIDQEHFSEVTPLSVEEVDQLCERLNVAKLSDDDNYDPLTDTSEHSLTKWLEDWDQKRPIWTVSMGGFNEGYELALQMMTVEIVRYFMETKPDAALLREKSDKGRDERVRVRKGFEERLKDLYRNLGVSGSQEDAAAILALQFYTYGLETMLEAATPMGRKIQIGRQISPKPENSV